MNCNPGMRFGDTVSPLRQQPRQISLASDGTADVMFQPSSVNERFTKYAEQLTRSIAANLGLPAELLGGDSQYASSYSMSRDYMEFQLAEWAVLYHYESRVRADLARQYIDLTSASACQAYLHHHRRLPGSDRTARLRKKRQTRVWAWWFARIV